jgi:hypothetical protein
MIQIECSGGIASGWMGAKKCDEIFMMSHFYAKIQDGPVGIHHANEWLELRRCNFFKHFIYLPINIC